MWPLLVAGLAVLGLQACGTRPVAPPDPPPVRTAPPPVDTVPQPVLTVPPPVQTVPPPVFTVPPPVLTVPPPVMGAPTGPPAPTPAPEVPAPMPGLPGMATEREWLQAWFQDTPVRIHEQDGTLNVEVPGEFSFDAGRSDLKPPLMAVLDKLAQSLLRLPEARLELVAAPSDDPSASGVSLATQRAMQVRQYLVASGVAASRMGPPTAALDAAVQLRIEHAAP